MSNCVYTGARVHIVEYGYMVTGDLFACGDVIIIKWNTRGGQIEKQPMVTSQEIEDSVTHAAFVSSQEAFHHEDLGITIVPRLHITGELRE
jgi:hypothetical protein